MTTDVTFLTPTGHMMIRLTDDRPKNIHDAALVLKAKRFVMPLDHMVATRELIWGVFIPGHKDHDGNLVHDPIKTFTAPTADPAVMWAELQGAR